MSPILDAVLPLFALILAGYVAGRRRVLGAHATDSLNAFVVWMALPALLFQAMAQISWEEIRQGGYIAASALAMAAIFTMSFLCDRREKRRLADASITSLAAAYGNSGYLGIPLCIMVLGAAASPCALVTIGLFLSQGSTTHHRSTVWRIVSLKLLVHPLLTFILVSWVFDMPPLWAHAAILLAALPVGTGPFMVAKLYEREPAITSEATLLSTVLSVVTVSALVAWINA